MLYNLSTICSATSSVRQVEHEQIEFITLVYAKTEQKLPCLALLICFELLFTQLSFLTLYIASCNKVVLQAKVCTNISSSRLGHNECLATNCIEGLWDVVVRGFSIAVFSRSCGPFICFLKIKCLLKFCL